MTREQAIKWLSNLKMEIGKTQHQELWHYEQALDEIIKVLEQEPKRGKWVDDNNSFNSFYANCSECGYQMDKHEERGYHNYCPYCGAKMRSGEQ